MAMQNDENVRNTAAKTHTLSLKIMAISAVLPHPSFTALQNLMMVNRNNSDSKTREAMLLVKRRRLLGVISLMCVRAPIHNEFIWDFCLDTANRGHDFRSAQPEADGHDNNLKSQRGKEISTDESTSRVRRTNCEQCSTPSVAHVHQLERGTYFAE